MKKRIMSMLLASVMCVTALAGCGGKSTNTNSPTVMTVNGDSVPASELAGYTYYTMSYYQNYFGMDASFFAEGDMFDDVKQSAADQAISLRSVEAMAKDLGVTLTKEDKDELAEVRKTNMEYLGAQTTDFKRWIAYTVKGQEDPWVQYLNSMGYTEELFQKDCEIMKLQENMIDFYNDEIVEKFNSDYLHAKSILISDNDKDGNALKGKAKTKAKKKAQKLLDEIKNGGDFDALWTENNDDPGQSEDGYYFVDGDMVQEYTDAVKELGDDEITDELVYYKGYGWFIVKRLPLDEKALDDTSKYMGNNGNGDTSTIKTAIGNEIVNEKLQEYVDKAEVEYTDEYDKINVHNLNTYLGFICDPLISTEGSGSVEDGTAYGSAE